ncbi:MAG: Ig-like domain-containing protein, partial [Eubacteriales bacterium]|nr:Ig-like domain-containing protein [Eubacteriales bacterium]
MENKHRRAISIVIAVTMVFGIMPVHFAGSGGSTQVYAAEEPVLSDAEAVASDKAWLTDEYMWGLFLGWIQEDLELPASGSGGSSIVWSSSHPDLIDAEGAVNRPAYTGVSSYDAVLTATIAKGTASDIAAFDVSVAPVFGSLGMQLDYADIDNTSGVLRYNGSAEPGVVYMSNPHLFSLNCSSETAGSVFTGNKIQLADDRSFSTYFLFDINSVYQAYDEGFTFTLQADSNAALGSGAFGSMGTVDVSPSLSIEFDTKRDSESAAWEYQGTDAEHHIAVYTNGQYQDPIAIAPAAVSREDGTREFSANQRSKVWIQYDGTAKKLEIYQIMEGLADPAAPLISVDLDLSGIFQTPAGNNIRDVYAGFTGHGADAFTIHASIYEWSFKNDPFPIEYDLPYSVQNLYKDASTVSLSAETMDSESTYASGISAVIRDSAGAPAGGVPIAFSTDFGALGSSSAITDANGCATVILTSPTSGTATVRATAQGGAYAETQAFLIVTDEAKLTKDFDLLTEDRLLNGNTALDFVRGNLSLPTEGENGSTISWSSANETFVTSAGTVARPTAAQGDQTVILTAHISNGTAARDKLFTITVKIPDADMVALDGAWLTDTKILNGNAAWDEVVSTLFMPDIGENGSSILWASSPGDVISTNGTVNRPAYPGEPVIVALSATVFMGEESETKTFSATVIPLDATDTDRVWEAYDALDAADLLNGNSDFQNVMTDLSLPEAGLHGSGISWVSSHPGVIAQTGVVARPAFLAGDAVVTLTATIAIGTESVTKIFTCTVKETDPTDEQAVGEALHWLTWDVIKGLNSASTQVTADLLLHTAGVYSTEIRWTSDHLAVIDVDGTVIQPMFSEGNATAKLTAIITRGESSRTKEFDITVPALASTDQEAVSKTWDLLTYEEILGENVDAQRVETSLTLAPVGAEGTTIRWSSTPEGFLSTDPATLGQLSPPSFTRGDVPVTLVAIIARGDKSLEKRFEVIVKAMPVSDEEAVTLDADRLRMGDTLGLNPSPYAVTENLIFSDASLYGSEITYTSSATDVVRLSAGGEGSIIGAVSRPGIGESNRSVTVTATVTRGNQQEVKVFEYTVIALRDVTPPVPVTIAPAHNSVDAAYNTKETVVTFDEDIMHKDGTSFYAYWPKYLNITLNGSLMSNDYMVRFEGNKLKIINTAGLMPAGRNEIFIPAGAVRDKSGNFMSDDLTIVYTVEERIVRNIGLASSVPADGAVNVPASTAISFAFDASGLIKGSNFNSIALMNEKYPSIPVQCELTDNEVNVTFKYPGWTLEKGRIYWLLIPGGAVQDRFLNQNETQLLSFVVSPDTIKPTVVSTFPAQNETGVSVLQHIQVNYQDAVIRSAGQVRITDETGKPVAFATGELRDFDTIQDLIPLAPLAPNTRYTVVIPADFVKTKMAPHEPATSDHTFSFTTGEDSLSIQSVNPKNFAWDVPLNGPIRLVFDRPVQRGSNQHLLSMTDSAGNDVGIFAAYNGSTVEIKPLSLWLEPYETYTLTIPAGLATDGEGNQNDGLTFTFTTGRKLDLSSGGSFTVQPSARYLVSKEITFDTATLQETFRKNARKVVSCQWDFGDGQTAAGLQTKHTYTRTGEYAVRLTATDNKGIIYELNQPVSIRSLDRENIEVIVTPEKLQNLIREDEYIDPLDGYPGRRLYTVYIKNEGVYLPDERIQVYLYKNGMQIKEIGTITTQNQQNGVPAAYFLFDYKNPSYLGNYELVFAYGNESDPDSGKTARRTVHVADQRKKQDLWIQPVNALTGEGVDIYPHLEFEVDGIKLYGIKKQEGESVYYVIKDLPTGFHSLKLIRTEGWAHDSDAMDFWHTSTAEIAVLPVRAASPGISRIWAKLETGKGPVEISSNGKDYRTFIDIPGAPGPPPIRFNIDMDWNETRPGYFEMQYNGWTERFYDPWFDFDPLGLYPGSKLFVRAVNPMGETSPWVDCKIATVESPTNPYVWLTYVDGEYLAETDMFMPDNVAGQIEGLDGMPLLDHSQSFGTQPGMNTAYGAIKVSNGKLYMDMSFDAAGSYGESKKKPKMVSVGYNLEGETGGRVYMIYDTAVGYWCLDAGEFYVRGDVSVYKEKGKVIPVISLGAKGRVT